MADFLGVKILPTCTGKVEAKLFDADDWADVPEPFFLPDYTEVVIFDDSLAIDDSKQYWCIMEQLWAIEQGLA